MSSDPYYSRVIYREDEATQGRQDFPVPFTYKDRDSVFVAINGTDTTSFTWLSDFTILLDTPLPTASVVSIYRKTDLDNRSVNFVNAAELDEKTLDDSADQVFYAMQEAKDDARDSIQPNPDGTFSMDGRLLQDLASPVNVGDGANKGYVDGLIQTNENLRDETQGYRDEALTSKNSAQVIKNDTQGIYNATVTIRDNTTALKNETQTIRDDTNQLKTDTNSIKSATDQIKSDTQALKDSAQSIHDSITPLATLEKDGIKAEGTTQKNAVKSEGTTQITAVTNEGGNQVGLVKTEGTTQVGLVQTQGTTQVARVAQAGDDKEAALQTALDNRIADVTAEGNTQVTRVQATGDAEVLRIETDGTQYRTDAYNEADRSHSQADRAQVEADRAALIADTIDNQGTLPTMVAQDGKFLRAYGATRTWEFITKADISDFNVTVADIVEQGVGSGLDADTVDGLHKEDLALVDHTHDDRYYTEGEVNTLLSGKSGTSHTHDDRYYTEAEVNALLNGQTHSASDITSGTMSTARLPAASTSGSGIAQLSNSYSGTAQNKAVTEKALKDGLATKSGTSHNHNSTYLGISATAADSVKLGGKSIASFLRSDADDAFTGNFLRFNDNKHLRFGSGSDVEFFCNGSHMYTDLNSGIGNWYIRDGSTTRFTFDDAGHFTATGNVTAYSDVRVKTNFETIKDALDKVCRLNGLTFDRTDNPKVGRQAGLIAQQVQEVLPEAVTELENGHLAVAYGNLMSILVEAIKELKEQVDAQNPERYF